MDARSVARVPQHAPHLQSREGHAAHEEGASERRRVEDHLLALVVLHDEVRRAAGGLAGPPVRRHALALPNPTQQRSPEQEQPGAEYELEAAGDLHAVEHAEEPGAEDLPYDLNAGQGVHKALSARWAS